TECYFFSNFFDNLIFDYDKILILSSLHINDEFLHIDNFGFFCEFYSKIDELFPLFALILKNIILIQ
ncbi:MAG: hypothetical protein DRO88_08815, partial [Promethearchaeia archaeon]